MNFELNKELNEKHAANPQAGDYWSERAFIPCFLVVDVSRFSVSFLSKTKTVQGDKFWDTSHIETCTHKEFKKRVSYNSIPGTWCEVTPNWKHAAEYINEAFEQALGEVQ